MTTVFIPGSDHRPTVYVETSVISYLAARPSGDLIARANQKVTHEWWSRRERFFLVISELVIEEISKGDSTYAGQRLAATRGLPLLELTEEVDALAELLLVRSSLPAKAANDAVHVAAAAVNGIDFLVTWNLKHIANAVIRPRIEIVCADAGYRCPNLCTPPQLLED